MTPTWPDLVVGFIVLIFALKGFKRGFVGEIGGFIALAAAVWAAFAYRGQLDPYARDVVHAGPGSAHVIGLITFAAAVYLVLLAISMVLGGIAKLPIINIPNAIFGAIVGALKACVGIWIVLYVLLFLPLPHDLRADLKRSPSIATVTSVNAQVDDVVRRQMPGFLQFLTRPFFEAHHS